MECARGPSPSAPPFDLGTLDPLPAPAQRYLSHVLPAGVPLSPRVELEMEGEISLDGRWLGFAATQILRGGVGFVWAPVVGGRVLRFVGADALGPVGARIEFRFMVSLGNVVGVVAASGFTGAMGALLGAGIGAVVRNVGGAVTLAVFTLMIWPPLVVQLASGTASWMPANLANVVSGTVDDVSQPAALLALAAWAPIPAAIGLIAVQRRDVL